MKKYVNFLLKQLFFLGIGKFIHWMKKDQITIVSMHGIMAKHENVQWHPLRKQLAPESLEATIKVLAKSYTFISLADAYQILARKKLPVKNGLVFTLDDGYWNNLHYAGPIFKKYNVLPTIFVATKNIDECSPFWFDRLDYALQQLDGEVYETKLLGSVFSFDLTTRASLKKSYALFRGFIKQNFSKDEEMRDLLNVLSDDIEAITNKSLAMIIRDDQWTRIASWTELSDSTQRDEFNVGSHTVDHIRIALVDENIMEFQLNKSKKQVESKLGRECKFFCYPNGSYDQQSAQKVSESGYLLAVTTQNGLNKIGDNLMTLKRFNIPSKRKKNDILHAISTFKV